MIQAIIVFLVLVSLPGTVCLEAPNSLALEAPNSLAADVQSAPYDTSSYVLHKFDCTEMSGIMEEHLTEQGWDARIIILKQDSYDSISHAQVIVYTDDTHFIVESTAKRVVDGTMPGFTVIGEYDNRSDAAKNSMCGYTEWYVGLGAL